MWRFIGGAVRLAAFCGMLPGTVVTLAADTLVVCPDTYRAALEPWRQQRQEQGHVLRIVPPSATARELAQVIQRKAVAGTTKYLVLVGDVSSVPTCYAQATINIRWGSEATIATDMPYGDLNGDGSPDLAVGRIPVDSPAELTEFVAKVAQYEAQADDGAWRRQLDVVAGVGGFGAFTDALIEAAARNVFQQVVPADYTVRQLKTDPAQTCAQISAGSFAWIYLGHGLPTMLDVAATPHGPQPILAVGDLPSLRCENRGPLAVLVACYTGAIDADQDCLAERLVLERRGPIAAIAATRVTMPYGNTVLGCELLRAAFSRRDATLGEVWLRGQQQTVKSTSASDSLRTSLDALSRGVSPPPVDLAAERREHVLLYQLLGDPLLRLQYPQTTTTTSAPSERTANLPNEQRAN